MTADFSDLNIFDIVILSIVFVSTLLAFFKGFIRTLLSFINWVTSFLVTFIFYKDNVAFLEGVIDNPQGVQLAATVGVFVALFLLIFMINSQLIRFFENIGFSGALDRTLGFAFGMVRGIVLVSIIFLSVNLVHSVLGLDVEDSEDGEKSGPKWFVEAKTYNMLEFSTAYLLSYVPSHLYKDFEGTVKTVTDKIPALAVPSGAPGAPKTLSKEDRRLIEHIVSALPEEDLAKLYKKHDGNTQNLSELERMAIYRDIIDLYRSNALKGEEEMSQALEEKDLQALYDSLSGAKNIDEEPTGYEKQQIKQMDRLIDTVQ